MGRDFAEIACLVLGMVREKKSIPDVLLMSNLHFTPDNWRHWRSKFIELFALQSFQKKDPENKNVRETVVYDKKLKLWSLRDV